MVIFLYVWQIGSATRTITIGVDHKGATLMKELDAPSLMEMYVFSAVCNGCVIIDGGDICFSTGT